MSTGDLVSLVIAVESLGFGNAYDTFNGMVFSLLLGCMSELRYCASPFPYLNRTPHLDSMQYMSYDCR